jgi:hypothetical protein
MAVSSRIFYGTSSSWKLEIVCYKGGLYVTRVVCMLQGWFICYKGGLYVTRVVYMLQGWFVCYKGGLYVTRVVCIRGAKIF